MLVTLLPYAYTPHGPIMQITPEVPAQLGL